MDKEKLCEDFLKNFKIAITNTSVYFKEHPIFIKSVEGFKEKLDQMLSIKEPLNLGIMPHSLVFGKEFTKEEKTYKDVADFFHCRKIKQIVIQKGIAIDELIVFLTKVNVSSKDILRKGGLNNILKKENLLHLSVEDLDYSQLLGSAGQECSDIWMYLLNKSYDDKDFRKVSKFADKFPEVIKNFTAKDFLENEETGKAIARFIDYYKDKDREKFLKYSQGLTKAILRSKDLPDAEGINKLKGFIEKLNAGNTADILVESFKEGKDPDSFNFALFSKLVDQKKHNEIAAFLAKRFVQKDSALANPRVIEGVKKLISASELSNASEVYSYNLSSLLEKVSLGKGFSYDHEQLKNNYRLVLLDLFSAEQNQKRLKLILERIIGAIDEVNEEEKIDYIKKFCEVLDKKNKESLSLDPLLTEANKTVSSFIENIIFSDETHRGFDYFVNIIKTSSFNKEFYLDNIFNKNKVNRYILQLFFKFFSDSSDDFYRHLNRKFSDVKFFEKFMDSLSGLDLKLCLDILKYIFSFAGNLLKIESLKMMAKFKLYDEDLLFSVLAKRNFLQVKYALLVLESDPSLAKKAVKQLLYISNPFGIKSSLIIENLKFIKEVPIKEAKEYLVLLTHYRFFWNKTIRMQANEVLEKHYV